MRLHCNFLVLVLITLLWSEPAVYAQETIDLKEAHTQALRYNHDLKNLQETMQQAEISIQRAWSILLPSVSLSGTITRNDEAIANIKDQWTKSASLSGSMMLFSPKSIPLIINAHKGSKATELSVDHAKSELLFGVTSAYYATVQAKKFLMIAKKNLERSEEYVKLAEARKKAGQAIRVDVLRAEMEKADAESAIIDAEGAYKLALQGLGFLIGKDEFEVPDSIESKTVKLGNKQQMLDHALDNRLDLKASKMQVAIAKRAEIQSWVSFLPDFLMQGSYDWTDATSPFTGNKTESWRLMFIANWPIFDGGAKIADARQNHSLYAQSKINNDKLEKEISNKVKEALIKLEQANAKYNSSLKKQELAKENYSLVKQQYELGLVDNLAMVDASTSLLQADQSLILAELSYKLAELSLQQASGFYIKVR